MSYSRWSNSRWYTYWSSNGSWETEYKWPTEQLKNSQVFEICDIPSYYITYGDLVSRSRSAVLHEIEEHFAKDFEWSSLDIVDGKLEPGKTTTAKGIRPTWEELNELQEYLSRFMKDVDEHFKWNNFFLYEWVYPFKSKIYWKIRKLKQRYVKNRSK